ncbi:hypothetical protein M406DRAFT_68017 [Cryphonectria parasitica EP155]|uniref:Fungal N-terminal domain-containing protein n=1 Tax=Cryphonectria parasitica (strain ATCC 38755 / EP155) TaxID=660469 RepID=A0A9P4Y241_CRYP1|nr:uncharacterized protein M406DRAFT_68017 [Cryphonectria parasitica EP155]KAF3765594.1 hypothetical protein M406DRAFT_68017 [Cryphonectria parasitica EP155]
MADVLGTVASAVQLAGLCQELYYLLKNARRTLRQYKDSVKDLITVSHEIKDTPVLQTPEITEIIKSLISLIHTFKFSHQRFDNRLRACWVLLRKRSDLDCLFALIETKKTNISLLVSTVQISLLLDVQQNIAQMNNQFESLSPTTPQQPKTFSQNHQKLPDTPPLTSCQVAEQGSQTHQSRTHTGSSSSTVSLPRTESGMGITQSSQWWGILGMGASLTSLPTGMGQQRKSTMTFGNIKMTGRGRQVNGFETGANPQHDTELNFGDVDMNGDLEGRQVNGYA